MKKIKIILILIIMITIIFNINYVKAINELPDNGAKISSAVITQQKTGTAPFDTNNDPGNDSSEDNNVVRSFDQITWTVENTMVLNSSGATSYSGGKLYFEAILPSEISNEEVKWDVDSMGWIEDATLSSDGLTLTGYYQMSKDSTTIPGKQTLVFIVKVLGAGNGTIIKPDIKVWLNGNNDEDKVEVSGLENVYVSSAPSYNIKLSRNSYCSKRLTVNYDSQEITGRMYGYSFIVQLYNNDKEKGMKGIEFPKGDITFDIDLKFERSNVNGTGLEDITQNCTPLLWNYKVNNAGGKGVIENRAMYWNNGDEGYNLRGAPFGVVQSDRSNSIYNSGNVIMQQNGSKITVTLKDYKFDGIFPQYNGEYYKNTIVYTDNIGCFSSWYFQILVPDNEYSIQANSNYYLTISDSNMEAKSITDQSMSNQEVTTDDRLQINHVRFVPGRYNHFLDITSLSGQALIGITNRGRGGDTVVTHGNVFYTNLTLEQSSNADEDTYITDANIIFKFDSSGLEPYLDKNLYSVSGMKFNAYYITKKDGSNWTSQEEMNNMCNINDFNIYKSKSDIPQGYNCIGIFFESQEGGVLRPVWNSILVEMKVKDNAEYNKTYGMTMSTRVWCKNNDLDRSIYTIENENIAVDSYPEPIWTKENMPYIKTEYDENGSMISGTHNGNYFYGNTIYVVAADQTVQISTVDENGNEKLNYDLGKNEYDINFKIESILSSNSDNIKIGGITVTITDTLPKGLTYVSGSSNYGDPEIIINDDGTSTLIWKIYDCIVEEEIEPITFIAHIDEETINGTQFTNKAVISADKIGNGKEIFRTDSTTIQVINLSSHRLYKSVNTPVIEKNGEIHYTVSYRNNTDEIIKDFQLLDILPYNGDGRGTEYIGDYTLDRLVVTQTNETKQTISNDNLEILYTNNEGVRSGVTSKDENLGAGWSIANSETVKQKATAYVVKGEVGAQSSVTVDVYLKTNGNKGLDKYVNSATAQVYKETEEITTSNVTSQVVERSIEGIAWEDSNRNGVKDEEEKVLSNVEIKLTDELGQQVTDVNGNKVTSVKTDSNGYYKFENLPKGEYYLQVVVPSEKYELTEKQVGTNNEINSKFNEEEKETDKITGLNSIDLPELKVSNVNAGFVKIEGSIEITKVDGKDNSKVIEGATFKVEKIDESGNVDNTYNIGEQTTGEDGKVLFEGLEVGKYRVTETKAPSGYELLEKSIEVEITGEKRDIKLTAENELKLELPETGSINYAIILGVVGIGIIVIAIVLNKKYKVINIKK